MKIVTYMLVGICLLLVIVGFDGFQAGRNFYVQGDLQVDGKYNGVKEYTALINQSGTSAPTALVIKNTLSGTPVWTRSAAGNYLLTLSGEFVLGKTAIVIGASQSAPTLDMTQYVGVVGSVNTITFLTYETEGTVLQLADECAADLYFSVRIYP